MGKASFKWSARRKWHGMELVRATQSYKAYCVHNQETRSLYLSGSVLTEASRL
jgi:hypothetical protein